MNRLDLTHRRSLYAVAAVLFLSGLCWAVLHYFADALGVGERQVLAVNAALMKIHGAAAMLGLLLLGTLLPRHVPLGWRGRLNKRSGFWMLLLSATMIATGYLLYYAGGEATRTLASYVHLGVGLLLPVLLGAHIRRVWRERREKSAERRRPAYAAR
jgi:hypothetical protein